MSNERSTANSYQFETRLTRRPEDRRRPFAAVLGRFLFGVLGIQTTVVMLVLLVSVIVTDREDKLGDRKKELEARCRE